MRTDEASSERLIIPHRKNSLWLAMIEHIGLQTMVLQVSLRLYYVLIVIEFFFEKSSVRFLFIKILCKHILTLFYSSYSKLLFRVHVQICLFLIYYVKVLLDAILLKT